MTNMEFVRSRLGVTMPAGPNVRAAGLLILAICLASGMSVCIRYLGGDYSPFQIVFVRTCVMLSVLLPMLLRTGLSVLATPRPVMIAFRALFGFAGQLLGVLAILNLPLSEVQALGFTKGFIVALLSLIFLGEEIRMLRWAAIFMGFIGVLIILQPEEGVNWTALYPIGSALCFSCNTIITKKLLATHSRQALMTYAASLQLMFAAIPTLFVWKTPELAHVPWFAGMGVIALCVQPLNLAAFRLGEVGALAPVEFFRLLTSSLVGYFLFQETPRETFWMGAAVIVVANIVSLRADRRRGNIGDG